MDDDDMLLLPYWYWFEYEFELIDKGDNEPLYELEYCDADCGE